MNTPALILLPALLGLLTAPTRAAAETADVQFFGDVFLPTRVLELTETSAGRPAVFDGVRTLLASARHNVINLEGVVSDTPLVPHQPKRHLLHMPPSVPAILKAAGIGAATLANNHSFDFGPTGLFDTMAALSRAGLAWSGAGHDAREALRPMILHTPRRTLCVIALSRALPNTFWATDTRPGTAYADADAADAIISDCAARGRFTVVSYHWGQELATEPQAYQRSLARRAIDAGADAVIGHHPHVLQGMEVYKNRPIIYSLGNFAFGTFPPSQPQGLAARVFFDNAAAGGGVRWDLVPLDVDNARVALKPRPYADEAQARQTLLLTDAPQCAWRRSAKLWSCRLPSTAPPTSASTPPPTQGSFTWPSAVMSLSISPSVDAKM